MNKVADGDLYTEVACSVPLTESWTLSHLTKLTQVQQLGSAHNNIIYIYIFFFFFCFGQFFTLDFIFHKT